MSKTSKEILAMMPRTDVIKDLAILPHRRRTKQQVDEALIQSANWMEEAREHIEKLEGALQQLSGSLLEERRDHLKTKGAIELHLSHQAHKPVERRNLFSRSLSRIFSS